MPNQTIILPLTLKTKLLHKPATFKFVSSNNEMRILLLMKRLFVYIESEASRDCVGLR